MKVTDLTHTIYSEMPVYPGTEQPILQKANTLEKDGFKEAKITMYSHTGTHIDAPAHMLREGLHLDDFEIDQFIGKAMILDFSKIKTPYLKLDQLRCYEEKIKSVDFIILKTGWSTYWGKHQYYENFPSLTEEAACWLSGFKLKGIGIDAISVDNMNTDTFAVHKLFLNKNILIIENLTNLESIDNENFIISIMPLKTQNADGSPVRAFAIEDGNCSMGKSFD